VTDTRQGGKGRPTPKRSEAVAARKKPLVAPKGKAARGADRAERAALRRTMREAMRNGEERHYPPIAAGPERAVVRDAVDARRSLGWVAISGWLLGMALTVSGVKALQTAGSAVFPFVVVVLVADSVLTARAAGAALDRHFPDGTEAKRKSLIWYGIARNTQFRRQRLPRPRVERGAEV
jgi:hypothetical protein